MTAATTRQFTVKGQTFESSLTNENAVAICAASTSKFGQDLARQYRQRHHLTEPQWAWAHKIANDQLKPATPTVTLGDVKGILDLFNTAGSRLKYPKIHLQTVGGQEICLSVAGPNSKQPGTVNVTNGGGFREGTWFGRIMLDGEFKPSRDCTDAITEYLVAFAQDPARIAAEDGRRTGRCCFCSLKLTDARSLEVGYGKRCSENYNLPWGTARHE